MRTPPTLSFSFANNFLSRHLGSKRTFHRINVTPGRQFVEFYFVRASLCSARNQNGSKKWTRWRAVTDWNREKFMNRTGAHSALLQNNTIRVSVVRRVCGVRFSEYWNTGSCWTISIATFRSHSKSRSMNVKNEIEAHNDDRETSLIEQAEIAPNGQRANNHWMEQNTNDGVSSEVTLFSALNHVTLHNFCSALIRFFCGCSRSIKSLRVYLFIM